MNLSLIPEDFMNFAYNFAIYYFTNSKNFEINTDKVILYNFF